MRYEPNRLLSPRHRFGSGAIDNPTIAGNEGLLPIGGADYWFGGGPMEGNSGDAMYDANGNRIDSGAGPNPSGGGVGTINAVKGAASSTDSGVVGDVEPYDFTGSPGYQFRYNEGLRALENGLIGRGLGLSGRAVKEAERFGQNYAADEFGAEFARNATLAGFSPPSIGSMNALIGNYAANAGNIAIGQGQAGANSAYNNANINSNFINSLIQGLGQFGQYMPSNTRTPYETYYTPVNGAAGAPF